MEYHHIKVEVKDAVQVITLNRPDVLNSFHLADGREVQDALAVAAADDAIRAVLLTGEGRGFCAGQDLAAVTFEDSKPNPDVGEMVRSTVQPDHPRHTAPGEAGGVRRERCRGRRRREPRLRVRPGLRLDRGVVHPVVLPDRAHPRQRRHLPAAAHSSASRAHPAWPC